MKDFFKTTAATIVGLLLFGVVSTIIGIISVAGIIASENATKPITQKSILKISLDGVLEERHKEDPLAILSSGEEKYLSLEDALVAIKKAKNNENIKGIYLEGGALGASPAMLQELRKSLLDFKESNKFILAYGELYHKNAYYLSSVADSVLLNPVGMLDWSGLSTQILFFKDVMEKIGVKMQVFKVGSYKSAVEPFINNEMSEANREQISSYLNGIWNEMVQEVALSRRLQPEAVDQLADTLTLLAEPAVSVQGGLVDKLCYINEVKDILKKMAAIDSDEDIHFVSIQDVVKSEVLEEKKKDQIAVYYAYGNIVDTRSNSIQNEAEICGKDMVKDLQELREDDDVKAVVIRINSGGGSAFASEQIWKEVKLLKEKKPVVVSMGGMAASGGYYIACEGDLIFAQPTTLTGSIGIFGMIPDASELLTKKIGLHADEVSTNKLSGFGSMMRPFNAAESAMMQNHVNKGYELFTQRVADGRNMKIEEVKAVAEGRVWTGTQAKDCGLVDRLGGLDDAIAAAAELAETEKYYTSAFPTPKPLIQQILNTSTSHYLEDKMVGMLGEYSSLFTSLREMKNQHPIQARLPYIIYIK